MKYLIAFLLIVVSSQIYAGTRDPNVSDDKYIEYGQKYECVLPIMGILSDELNSNFRASCVVIDEYHVLTAAHIVYGSVTQHVLFDNKAYPCALIAVHALYDPNKMGSYDIAIARLQQPIKLDFYPELYTNKDEEGKVCGLAGYGFYGTFKTGYLMKNYDNKKRAGSNIIDGVEHNVLTYSVNKGKRTNLEFLITPGDSGGGLFIDQKLAGIHSFIYAVDQNANADYGDVGCSTRISDYADWINKTKIIIDTICEGE